MKRSAEELLKDLVQAVRDHEFNRDCELEFYSDHGYESEYWDEGQTLEQERICRDIRESHDRIQGIVAEYLGDEDFTF